MQSDEEDTVAPLTPRLSSFPPGGASAGKKLKFSTPETVARVSETKFVYTFKNEDDRTERRFIRELESSPTSKPIAVNVEREAFVAAARRVAQFVADYEQVLDKNMLADFDVISKMVERTRETIYNYQIMQPAFEELVKVTGDTGYLFNISNGVRLAQEDAQKGDLNGTLEVLKTLEQDVNHFRAAIKEASTEHMSPGPRRKLPLHPGETPI